MAIMQTVRDDVSTDVTDAVEFSFSKAGAAKLQKMMSDYLYSDKEYAVVSELSANAVDAHVLVGKKDVPVFVQLPTDIESELVVKDYGPGLSEADVYKYLTTYGESSKSDSNEAIGTWGVGSKSPAAVSDNWSIISHNDGKKMHFEVFVTPDGTLSLKKIFEGSSNETGLEVRVPIANANWGNWKAAATRAFKYYDVEPTINVPLNITRPNYLISGPKWSRRDVSIRSIVSKSSNLITTFREYKIDFTKVLQGLPESSIARRIFTVNDDKYFDLFFGIGEIDLSISREQIQYTDKSIKAIQDRLIEIVSELTDKCKADLATAKDQFDYRQKAYVWYQGYGSTFLSHIVAGKHGIASYPKDLKNVKLQLKNPPEDFSISLTTRGVTKKMKTNFGSSEGIAWNTNWIDDTNREHFLTADISSWDRFVFVERDCHDASARLRHASNTNSSDNYNIFVLMEKNCLTAPFRAKVVKASKFEKAPRKLTKSSSKRVIEGYYIIDGKRFLRMTNDEFDSVDPAKIFSVKITDARNASLNPEAVTEKSRLLRQIGWKMVGCKHDKSVFLNTDEALNYALTMIENSKELEEAISKSAIGKAFQDITTSKYSNVGVFAIVHGIEFGKSADLLQPLKPCIDLYSSVKSFYSCSRTVVPRVVGEYENICKMMGKTPKQSGLIDIRNILDKLNAKYPLLASVKLERYEYAIEDDLKKAVLDYIEMVDNK